MFSCIQADMERIDKITNTDSIILETIDKFLLRGEIGFAKYKILNRYLLKMKLS
jgi:hypothetical protein